MYAPNTKSKSKATAINQTEEVATTALLLNRPLNQGKQRSHRLALS